MRQCSLGLEFCSKIHVCVLMCCAVWCRQTPQIGQFPGQRVPSKYLRLSRIFTFPELILNPKKLDDTNRPLPSIQRLHPPPPKDNLTMIDFCIIMNQAWTGKIIFAYLYQIYGYLMSKEFDVQTVKVFGAAGNTASAYTVASAL